MLHLLSLYELITGSDTGGRTAPAHIGQTHQLSSASVTNGRHIGCRVLCKKPLFQLSLPLQPFKSISAPQGNQSTAAMHVASQPHGGVANDKADDLA